MKPVNHTHTPHTGIRPQHKWMTTMWKHGFSFLMIAAMAITGWADESRDLRRFSALKVSPEREQAPTTKTGSLKKARVSSTVNITPAQADTWDPDDDTTSGATLLEVPVMTEQEHGPHTLGDADQVDIFRVVLTEGVPYRFTSTSDGSDTVMELLDADTETLRALDDDGGAGFNAEVLFIPESTGDYLIAVSLFDASVVSSYSLTYQIGFPEQDTPGDAWDPDDDSRFGATLLNEPTNETQVHGIHRLDVEDQYDWFEITLQQGESYFFETTGSSDLVGTLFAQDGATILQINDDTSGENLNFRVLILAEETTTYFIRVQAFDDSIVSEYSLSYGILQATDGDEWDPEDNSPAGATLLAFASATQAHGPHTFSAGDFADWFTFTLQANTPYVFESTGAFDVWGELIDSDGVSSLFFDDDGGNDFNFLLPVVVEETGTYYLRVSPFSQGSDAEYTLLYTEQNADDIGDEWDPIDDRVEGATLLAAPASDIQTHGPHTFDEGDSEDWFRVALEAGTTYEFFSTGSGDPLTGIFASDGESLLETDDDGGEGTNFRLRYTPEASGEFFLLVLPFAEGDSFEYTLNYLEGIVVPDIPGDVWDPDDDVFSGATVMPAPSDTLQTHGPHTLSVDDPYDWFQFALKAGETYLFESTGDTDTIGLIYASDGITPLVDDDDSGDGLNFRIVFSPERNDLYYLRILPYDDEAGAAYSLQYSQTEEDPLEGDAWDPGDDFRTGATELGEPVVFAQTHGPHTLAGPDEADWYMFTLRESAVYRFSVDESLSLIGELYSGDGETLLIDNLDEDRVTPLELVITPGATDNYLIRIRRAVADEQIEYDLEYILLEGAPGDDGDEWDPEDNSSSGATVLDAPTDVPQTHGPHSLSEIDAFDWFLVSLEAGVSYQFESTGDGDLVGELIGLDGQTILAANDDGGDQFNFSLIYTPMETAPLYLRARAYDVGAVLEYSLVYQIADDSATGADEWDPVDDLPATATVLDPAGEEPTEHGLHTLSNLDTEDWFQLAVEVGFEYTITALGESDTVGLMYAPDLETLLALDDDSGEGHNFLIRYVPDRAETVYLLVNEFSSGAAAYTLQYSASLLGDSVGDKWDPGDDVRGGATALGIPQPSFASQGPHQLIVATDQDWFSFDLQAGTEYRFWSTGRSDPVASLYFEEGTEPVLVNDDGSEGLNFEIVLTPEQSGTFYLLVNKVLATNSSEYWLNYEEVSKTGVHDFMLH